MKYRKEIDGLRSVAVVPVLFFHAGITSFSGGFFGVDIFFVISGYLITSILASELKDNRFSIVKFYERRARRIIPALFAVMITTTFFALLMLSPNDLKDYSQSMVAVVTFASNIYFYFTSGYFATATEELPLIHTWSLAVEEQFYLFFPLIMWFFWAKKSHRLTHSLVFLTLLSFICCLYYVNADPSANFYLIQSRAWELFAGSLIALHYRRYDELQQGYKESLSVLGLLMILASIFVLDKSAEHPGWPTLLPVIGTCLVIACSRNTLVARLLSAKLLVSIGLISYSLYLWHQPIYALIRIKNIEEPSGQMFFWGTLLSFLLAWISYKYIEAPFRNKQFLSQKNIFTYTGVTLSIFLVFGLAGHLQQGWQERFDLETDLSSIEHSPNRKCHTRGTDYLKPSEGCRLNGSKANWAVLGDSHGIELSNSLAKKLKTHDSDVLQLTFSGCPPALSFSTNVKGCSAWLNDALNYLQKDVAIEHVIIAYRHTRYLYGLPIFAKENNYEKIKSDKLLSDNQTASIDELHNLYWQSVDHLILELMESGKNVYLLYPIPELKTHVIKLVIPMTIFNQDNQANLSSSIALYQTRNNGTISKLESISKKYKLRIIDPVKGLCDAKNCYVVKQNKVLYFDDNHLSVSGADLMLINFTTN